ncbi:MAG: glycosyltransferase [Thermoanaerobaculia bacterium]
MTSPLLYTVLPRPTHPTRDGLAIRNYHLLVALARRFRVRSFVLVAPHLKEEPEEYPPGVEVERVPQPPRGLRRLAAVAAALSGGAYSPRLYASRALEQSLSRAAAREKPSWVVAQSYHVAPAARAAGAPVWVDFHNVDSRIWRRLGENASSPSQRRFARSQAPRVERFEKRILETAEGLSCVSEIDAAVLRALEPRATALVVPNGVDLARYAPRPAAPREEVVFFVGDLTWAPNVEGIRWLRREVWPLVTRLRPAARAEVLGRGGERLRKEGDVLEDFVFLGAGGDTRPAWQRAAVAVVPLFSGGGTRLKILEAAACGVPVVSTSVGVEGLSFAPDEVLVRDDAAGFAEAVAQLLSGPETARRQAAAARARVEREYGWDAIGQRFAEELARRIGDSR